MKTAKKSAPKPVLAGDDPETEAVVGGVYLTRKGYHWASSPDAPKTEWQHLSLSEALGKCAEIWTVSKFSATDYLGGILKDAARALKPRIETKTPQGELEIVAAAEEVHSWRLPVAVLCDRNGTPWFYSTLDRSHWNAMEARLPEIKPKDLQRATWHEVADWVQKASDCAMVSLADGEEITRAFSRTLKRLEASQ